MNDEWADADYEVGDGTCGLHADGKQANEPAIVYVRADALIDAHALVAEALEPWVDVACESLGVAGYHLNGDVAGWDEFDMPSTPADAIAAREARDKRVKEAALREAASVPRRQGLRFTEDAILALIEEDQPTDDDVDRANSLISTMTARIRELEAAHAGIAGNDLPRPKMRDTSVGWKVATPAPVTVAEAARERVARAICAEKCAFMGEPPCHRLHTFCDDADEVGPHDCPDDVGCLALADAALLALAGQGGE